VLCCVKSVDTEAAGAELAPQLQQEAIVLSLQNGVDNAARLRDCLPCAVAAAVVYVGAEMAGPGHVRHHGRGELVIGRFDSAPRIAELLVDAGIPTQVSDNVVGALWAKLVLNCAYNALSALTRQTYGRLIESQAARELMRTVMQECLAVARADGVAVPGDTWEEVLRIARTMPQQYSSTAQDLARGKPSEIDHLNGYVVRRGAALGVAVPVNQALQTLVRLLESKASGVAGD
jgi:2-dehydropantoate 2-reductase